MTGVADKDLIVSYATNVAAEDFTRLVVSARASVSRRDADIVVLTNPDARVPSRLATDLAVELLPVSSTWSPTGHKVLRLLWRLVFESLERQKIDRPPFAQLHRTLTSLWAHPILARHFAYLDLLQLRPHYRMVLLSDARDVVFQSNPFVGLSPDKLHVFLQDPSIAYGGDNIDTRWYRGTFGDAALAQVRGKPVVCAGTILGGAAAVIKLLHAMVRHVLAHKRGGIDQAILNFILANEFRAEELVVHENLGPTVLTLGDVPNGVFRLQGDEVRVGDHVPAILHQYDRVSDVQAVVHRRFAEPRMLEQALAQSI